MLLEHAHQPTRFAPGHCRCCTSSATCPLHGDQGRRQVNYPWAHWDTAGVARSRSAAVGEPAAAGSRSKGARPEHRCWEGRGGGRRPRQGQAFWTGQIGFDATVGKAHGIERWIEVTPPDTFPVLVRRPQSARKPRCPAPGELTHSDLIFTCQALQQTGQDPTARGVRFPAPSARMPCDWWPVSGDPGGGGYPLGQQD